MLGGEKKTFNPKKLTLRIAVKENLWPPHPTTHWPHATRGNDMQAEEPEEQVCARRIRHCVQWHSSENQLKIR